MGEVDCHRNLGKKALEKNYTEYLLYTRGAVQSVLYIDLWGKGGVNDVDALLAHLDDCHIAVWIADSSSDQGYTTVIPWESLTKPDGKISLYMSDLIANGKNGVTLPEEYIRPKGG